MSSNLNGSAFLTIGCFLVGIPYDKDFYFLGREYGISCQYYEQRS